MGMAKTIVVKVGTSTLTRGTPRLSKPTIIELVRQIVSLHQAGHRVLLVSSGAMAAGKDHLGHPKLPTALPVKQMLSAIGQGQLMQIYSDLFGLYGVKVGQILVTREDLLRHRTRYLNARDTLDMLLANSIVPIINENDTVAVDEIKIGDNDNLSALIASLINADLLILLTDREGLFDKDPSEFPDAQRIVTVKQIDDDLRAMAGGPKSGLGTGGMQTKLQAAELAGRSGTETIIAQGTMPDVILRIMDGEEIGTRFLPTAPRVESRKRWLLAEPISGQLVVDDGAANVLRQGAASLLPVGITHVEGDFVRGSLVGVCDSAGIEFAHGLANYSSVELTQLCGVKSRHIEATLGYSYGDEAIHRDNFVLLQMEE